MRVLVVEDEPKMAAFIKKGLEEEQYAVDVLGEGSEVMDWVSAADYDLVVLDVLLPGKDGFIICQELRQGGFSTPILMLTAKDSIEDRVKGLDFGADDYLVKPFAFKELLARMRALLRRPAPLQGTVLELADLKMDTIRHLVTRGEQPIELTPKEYTLLEYLLRHPDQVLKRNLIAEHLWNFDFYSESNVVDVYIRNLRRKLDDNFTPRLIHTVRGTGYVLSENIVNGNAYEQ
jgi:heavy metal response regulator